MRVNLRNNPLQQPEQLFLLFNASFMKRYLLICSLFFPVLLHSQNSSESQPVSKVYAEETFKSSRVVLGQSIEISPKGELVLLISHHFGAINTGSYEFFGLDQASTRIGVEYGINDFLGVGIGRSTYNKTFDGYLKGRILRQSKGNRNMPLSLSLFGNMAVNTLKLSDPAQKNYFDARLSYCTELIIARKFGNIYSLQIEPAWTHWNLVPTPQDHNDLFSLGTGMSFRISDVVSLNGEYHYLFPNQHLSGVTNSVSISCDLKVSQHIFQLYLTNSQGNFEQAFITQTTGKWENGYIYFGFNLHRMFPIKKAKS